MLVRRFPHDAHRDTIYKLPTQKETILYDDSSLISGRGSRKVSR